MKMWEQSIQTTNAVLFLEKHQQDALKLGFKNDDLESWNMFYNEIFSNPEVQLPDIVTLPEKADDWITWETPKQVYDLAKRHEDKTMIAKWAF